MDLKQLEYFVHVAELGSFTRAATLLSVAQPALSRQVRLLEIELRQNLLYRNGRGVTPTEPGKRLLAHGRGILEQVSRARQELDEIKGAPVGHVIVGLPPSVGRALSTSLVEKFSERFPKATLGVVEGLTVYIQEWLAMGRVDVSLLYNPVPSPHLETLPVVEDRLYLIGPAASAARRKTPLAVPLAALQGYRLIVPARPHAMRMHVETQMANLGLKMKVAWEIDGISTILDLVRQGYGHAVLPIHAVAGREGLVAQPIVKPRLASVLVLATAAQRPLTPLARSVAGLLRELAPPALQQRAIANPHSG
ncbi:MAG: LysR family transcriptional regulator [Betaproteobacteria bacterium]